MSMLGGPPTSDDSPRAATAGSREPAGHEVTPLESIVESASFASTILAQTPIVVILRDLHGIVRYVNPVFEKLTGHRAEDVLGADWTATLVPERQREQVRALAGVAIGGGNPTRSSVSAVVAADGREIALEWYDRVLVADGEVVGLLAVGVDISAREQQADTLDRQAEFLREISDAIVMTDLTGVITDVSPSTERTFGFPPEELVGRHVRILYPPEEWARLEQEVIEPLQRKGSHRSEVVLQTRSGSRQIADLRLRLLYDSQGRPTGMAGFTTDITEVRLAQREAANSEAHLRRVLDSMFAFVAILTPDGVILDANDAPFAASGLSRESTIGKLFWETPFFNHSGEERERLAGAIRSTSAGAPIRVEVTVSVGPAVLTFDASFSPLIGPDGQTVEIVAFGVDVTERRRAEEALRDNEERLRIATEVFGVGIFEFEFDGEALHWSPAQRTIYGVGAEEPVDNALDAAHVHPHDRERLVGELRRAESPQGDGRFASDHRIVRADGSVRWLESRAKVEFTGEGAARRPLRVIGGELDVTARHEAEAALVAREQRLRQAEAAARLGHFAVDLDGSGLFVSDGFRVLFGFAPDETVTLADLFERIHPDDRAAQAADYERSARDRGTSSTEYRAVRPDGSVLVVASVVEVEQTGEGGRFFGTVMDVTEQRRAEELLQRTTAELAAAQKMARIGSWELDLGGGELRWSDEIYRIFEIEKTQFGASYEAFLGLIHPDDRAAVDAAYTGSLESRRPYSIIHRLRLPDGRIKHVHEYSETDYAPDGTPLRSRGTVQDVTDLYLAEQEVRTLNDELELRVERRTAELAAANRELEMFSYSVSHDLKAPLRSIDGYSRLLVADHAGSLDEDALELLGNVRRAALLMSELIDDLLAYSRLERRELTAAAVRPAALVDAILADRADEIAARGVAVSVAVEPVELSVDREGLVLVLRNLVDNALKFLGDTPSPAIAIEGRVEKGTFVIRVRDNGIGFDMRFHARIFEVFQRLQRAEDFPGTGIGLAIVRRAVERMGGVVRAESAPGAGSSFIVELTL
jgi:PAS domain S-box-containing protein